MNNQWTELSDIQEIIVQHRSCTGERGTLGDMQRIYCMTKCKATGYVRYIQGELLV